MAFERVLTRNVGRSGATSVRGYREAGAMRLWLAP